jgi:hypothetical protein
MTSALGSAHGARVASRGSSAVCWDLGCAGTWGAKCAGTWGAKWGAQMRTRQKHERLGWFDKEEEAAARAYDAEALRLKGAAGVTDFPASANNSERSAAEPGSPEEGTSGGLSRQGSPMDG